MGQETAGKKTTYDPELKKAVLEDVRRTTIAVAAETWGIPKGTVRYSHYLRRRKAGSCPRSTLGSRRVAARDARPPGSPCTPGVRA